MNTRSFQELKPTIRLRGLAGPPTTQFNGSLFTQSLAVAGRFSVLRVVFRRHFERGTLEERQPGRSLRRHRVPWRFPSLHFGIGRPMKEPCSIESAPSRRRRCRCALRPRLSQPSFMGEKNIGDAEARRFLIASLKAEKITQAPALGGKIVRVERAAHCFRHELHRSASTARSSGPQSRFAPAAVQLALVRTPGNIRFDAALVQCCAPMHVDFRGCLPRRRARFSRLNIKQLICCTVQRSRRFNYLKIVDKFFRRLDRRAWPRVRTRFRIRLQTLPAPASSSSGVVQQSNSIVCDLKLFFFSPSESSSSATKRMA